MALLRKQPPKLRKTKSASEAKELTPNFDWRTLVKDTKSSKQRRELHAGMAEKIPKSVPEEEPIGPSDWLKKAFFEKKQEIKDLELNAEVLRKKIDEQKNEIGRCNKNITDLNSEYKNISQQYNTVSKEKFQLELDLKERESRINKLTEEKEEYAMKISHLELEKESLREDCQQRDKDIVKLKSDLADEEQEKTDLQNSLEFKADNLKAEKTYLEKEIDLKTVQIADLFKDLSIEEDKTASYEKEIEQLKTMNGELSDDLKTFNEQNKDLNKKLNDKVRDYFIIENDYDKLTTDHERVLNLNKELTVKNENLLKRINAQKIEINEFCQKVDIFQSELATIDLAKETLAVEKNELLTQLEDLEQEFENLSINHENVNTENDSRKLKIDQLTNKLIEQDELIASNEAKINELSQELLDKSEEISQIEVARMDQEDCTNKVIEDLEAIIAKQTNESNNSKSKLKYQDEMITNLKTEIDTMSERSREDIDTLQNENDTQTLQISQLKHSLDQIKTDLSASQEKCEKHKRKENQLTNEIILLKSKVGSMQQDSQLHEEKINELQNELDNSNMKYEESKMTNESHRVNIKLLDETILQLEKKAKFSEDKIMELKQSNASFVEQIDQLKLAHGEAIKQLTKEKDQTIKEIEEKFQGVKNELEERKKQHHVDMDDIVKNFGDLENELSFCQEELNAKSEELLQLKSELEQVKNESKARENALSKELGSLNEQNEMILQNEVTRYKAECDERLREYREKNTNDLTTIHNDFQEKIEYLKTQYNNTKTLEIENIEVSHNEKVSEMQKEKVDLEEKIGALEEVIKTQNITNDEKSSSIEQKLKLIDTLTTRIETQQKLIDYMMKALNDERQRKSDVQIIGMLSDIKEKVSDKSDHQPKQVAFYPNHSFNRDGQMSRLSSTHSSIYSNESDTTYPISPSPVSSPRYRIERDSIIPASASTPNQKAIPLPYHKTEDEKFAQSLPESDFHDLGYDSPGLGNSYQSIYFEDQIKSLTKTFQNMEHIVPSRENKADMDVWKQKVHFRLKALENQMNQLEQENTICNQSNEVISSGWLALQRAKNEPITYRPSNEQIRVLIDTVNQKYQTLNGNGIPV